MQRFQFETDFFLNYIIYNIDSSYIENIIITYPFRIYTFLLIN